MMMAVSSLFFSLCFLGLQFKFVAECRSLNGVMKKYDVLSYDAELITLRHNHMRHDDVLHLKLKAFGRNLHLELRKDSGSLFTTDYRTMLSNGTLINEDLSFLYSGIVKGIPESHCWGSVIQGIFQGSIILPTETFYIESSNRFFNKTSGFHSIIYRDRDVKWKPRPKSISEDCTSFSNKLTPIRDKSQFSRRRNKMTPIEDRSTSSRRRNEMMSIQDKNKSGRGSNKMTPKQDKKPSSRRYKRAINNIGNKNTCTLYLRSDQKLWTWYFDLFQGDVTTIRQQIISELSAHVNAVNRILKRTVFQTYNGSLGYQGIQLAIRSIQIMTDVDCNLPYPSPVCEEFIDSENFLNLVSLENYDAYCLAFVFTRRDFTNGILGRAYIAGLTRAGGICEKYKQYHEDSQTIKRSLNSGMVTNLNNGITVTAQVSHLNFAQQIGHSLGSPFDSGSVCVPYGSDMPNSEDGNYIMFNGAISGDRPNNDQFSTCSLDNITRVLENLIDTEKLCFFENGSFCGNQLVEDEEECDCGFTEDCHEICCYPRNSSTDNSDMCKLKTDDSQVCSPSQGPCCSDSCQYISPAENRTCHVETECTETTYCTGLTASCPRVAKADDSYCEDFSFLCRDGECAGSLCEKIGWTQCFGTNEECILACVNGTSSQNDCISSSDTAVVFYPEYKQLIDDVRGRRQASVPDQGILLKKGSLCKVNNSVGYCDVFFRCRPVNSA